MHYSRTGMSTHWSRADGNPRTNGGWKFIEEKCDFTKSSNLETVRRSRTEEAWTNFNSLSNDRKQVSEIFVPVADFVPHYYTNIRVSVMQHTKINLFSHHQVQVLQNYVTGRYGPRRDEMYHRGEDIQLDKETEILELKGNTGIPISIPTFSFLNGLRMLILDGINVTHLPAEMKDLDKLTHILMRNVPQMTEINENCLSAPALKNFTMLNIFEKIRVRISEEAIKVLKDKKEKLDKFEFRGVRWVEGMGDWSETGIKKIVLRNIGVEEKPQGRISPCTWPKTMQFFDAIGLEDVLNLGDFSGSEHLEVLHSADPFYTIWTGEWSKSLKIININCHGQTELPIFDNLSDLVELTLVNCGEYTELWKSIKGVRKSLEKLEVDPVIEQERYYGEMIQHINSFYKLKILNLYRMSREEMLGFSRSLHVEPSHTLKNVTCSSDTPQNRGLFEMALCNDGVLPDLLQFLLYVPSTDELDGIVPFQPTLAMVHLPSSKDEAIKILQDMRQRSMLYHRERLLIQGFLEDCRRAIERKKIDPSLAVGLLAMLGEDQIDMIFNLTFRNEIVSEMKILSSSGSGHPVKKC